MQWLEIGFDEQSGKHSDLILRASKSLMTICSSIPLELAQSQTKKWPMQFWMRLSCLNARLANVRFFKILILYGILLCYITLGDSTMSSNMVIVVAWIRVTPPALFFSSNCLQKLSNWLLFAKYAPFVTLGIGGKAFLVNVFHRNMADFGEDRFMLLIAFVTIILLSFCKIRELLSIRGSAVLLLVCFKAMLDNVYCARFGGKIISFLLSVW
jgi:hypothetical protein